jgi:hypothetical protein
MPRYIVFLVMTLLAALAAGSAAAHHVWIEQDDKGARLFFGEFNDNLREASPGLLDRFVQPTATHISGTGTTPLRVEKSANAYVLSGKAVTPGDSIVAEEARYPIMERKSGEQVIRTVWTPAARYITDFTARPPTLTLDIVPDGEPGGFKLFYKGQPLPKAKVEVIALSGWARQMTTDAQGAFTLTLPWKGLYAIEVRHTDRTPGERDGHKFDVASFVTTLTFIHASGLESPPAPPAAPPNK